MPPILSRALTAVGLLAVILGVIQALVFAWSTGTTGVALVVSSSAPNRFVVRSNAHPRTIALRPGDVIALADTGFSSRMRYLRARPGDAFAFVRERGGARVTLRYEAGNAFSAYAWITQLVRVAMAVCALVIVIRRWNTVEARALAFFFTMFALALDDFTAPWESPSEVFAALTINAFFLTTSLAQAVRFATLFPDPHVGGTRRAIRLVNRVVAPIYIVVATTVTFASYAFLWTPPDALALFADSSAYYYLGAIGLAFAIANRRAKPEDRERVRWVSLSVAVGLIGPLFAISYYLATRTLPLWASYANLTLALMPLGTAYAILRHRVLDIAFAINRALAFSFVSAIVLVTFGCVEWLAGKVLVDASHVTSASLEVAISLVLGFFLRAIHRRCETIVDDLFFRKRHESLARLRLFASDAAYISDLRLLVSRTVETITREEHAARCAVYLRGDDGTFAAVAVNGTLAERIDANDPAIVRARALRAPVALADVRSSLDADTAFPLMVRDALIGLLVCGARTDDERYAPDERDALETVARAVASAIDALEIAALRTELELALHGASPAPSAPTIARATGGAA
jgi:hypothetical protein